MVWGYGVGEWGHGLGVGDDEFMHMFWVYMFIVILFILGNLTDWV